MKLIFLDIDGVLNTKATLSTSVRNIDGDKLSRLAFLAKAGDAKIVLSSSWRLLSRETLTDTLSCHDLSVIGATPSFNGNNRKSEILAFLRDFEAQVESFVILDDQTIRWGSLKKRLVRTVPSRGLTDANVEKALKILSIPCE